MYEMNAHNIFVSFNSTAEVLNVVYMVETKGNLFGFISTITVEMWFVCWKVCSVYG